MSMEEDQAVLDELQAAADAAEVEAAFPLAENKSSIPAGQSCSSCKFSVPISTGLACRRFPPLFSTMNSQLGWWPCVQGSDWCGEYLKV